MDAVSIYDYATPFSQLSKYIDVPSLIGEFHQAFFILNSFEVNFKYWQRLCYTTIGYLKWRKFGISVDGHVGQKSIHCRHFKV
jgi:hypothetical protein